MSYRCGLPALPFAPYCSSHILFPCPHPSLSRLLPPAGPHHPRNLMSATQLWSLAIKTVLPTTKQPVQEPRSMPSRSLCSVSTQLMTLSPPLTVSTGDPDALGPRGNGPCVRCKWRAPGPLAEARAPNLLSDSSRPSSSPTGCPTLSPRCTASHGPGRPHRLPGRTASLAALLHEPPPASVRRSHLPAPGRVAGPQVTYPFRGRQELTRVLVQSSLVY